MKMKLCALLLALSLALSLAACGGRNDSQDSAPGTGAPETNAPEITAPDPGAPGETASQEDVDLSAFYSTLLEETEWPELMPLEGEPLDGFYPGLSGLSPKQCLVSTAAISAAVGEIALVEVENAEDVQTVKDIFQARIDDQVGDDNNPGGAWYPETIEGWKTKSQIVSHGNYVMLAVGDAAEAAVDRFNALFA